MIRGVVECLDGVLERDGRRFERADGVQRGVAVSDGLLDGGGNVVGGDFKLRQTDDGMEFLSALFEILQRVSLGFGFGGNDAGSCHKQDTKKEIAKVTRARKTVKTVP